jgi:hypothetical protein
MPFFDEESEMGGSVTRELLNEPMIEPSWSWSLQYNALGYAISNWSSINDYAPEFYRFTKIALQGTPEDIDYITPAGGTQIPIVTFTDPETRFVVSRAGPACSCARRPGVGDPRLPARQPLGHRCGPPEDRRPGRPRACGSSR